MSETDQKASGTDETLSVPVAALNPSLEAVLMVADQPLDAVSLATAVGYPVSEVVSELQLLAEEYAAVVEGFVLEGQQARLTQAALETLAVVAYKQPVSRARVSAIRGVNVDGVMRTLLTRGLVEEAGQDHETGANLYRTTGYFLERIGVSSLDDLPELAPYLPDMEDLEDELEAVANTQTAATEPQPEPQPEPGTEPRPEPGPGTVPVPEPGPGTVPTPEPGPGTEPDGGTDFA